MTPSGRSSSRRRSPSDEEAGEIPEHDPTPGLGARLSSSSSQPASNTNNISGSCLSSYASLANMQPPSSLLRASSSSTGSNNNTSSSNANSNDPPSNSRTPRGGGGRSSYRGGGGGRGHGSEARGSRRRSLDSSVLSNEYSYGGKREGGRGGKGGRFSSGRGDGQRSGGRGANSIGATGNRRMSLASNDTDQDMHPRHSLGDRFTSAASSAKLDSSQGSAGDHYGSGGGSGRSGGRFWRGGDPSGRSEKRRNSLESTSSLLPSERGSSSHIGGSSITDRASGGGQKSYRGGGGGGRFSRGTGRGRSSDSKTYSSISDGRNVDDSLSSYGPSMSSRDERGRGNSREFTGRGFRGSGRGRSSGSVRYAYEKTPVEVTKASSVSVVSDYTSIIAGDAAVKREKEMSKLTEGNSDTPSVTGAKRPRESSDGNGGIAPGNQDDFSEGPGKKLMDTKDLPSKSVADVAPSISHISDNAESKSGRQQLDRPLGASRDGDIEMPDPPFQYSEPGKTLRSYSDAYVPSVDPVSSTQQLSVPSGPAGINRRETASKPESRQLGEGRPRFEPKQHPLQGGPTITAGNKQNPTYTALSSPSEREPLTTWKTPPIQENPPKPISGPSESAVKGEQHLKRMPFAHYGDREVSAPPQHETTSVAGSLSHGTSGDPASRANTRWGGTPPFVNGEPSESRSSQDSQPPFTDRPLDRAEPLHDLGGRFEERPRVSPRYGGKPIVGGRVSPGGRMGITRDEGGRLQNDTRGRGFQEGRGRSANMYGYGGRGDNFAGGRNIGVGDAFGGGPDSFVARGEGFGGRAEGGLPGRGRAPMGGFGAGRMYGRSGGRGRADYARGVVAPGGRSGGRFGDMAYPRGPFAQMDVERRFFDDNSNAKTSSSQHNAQSVVNVQTQDSNQSFIGDYVSMGTSAMSTKDVAVKTPEKANSLVSQETASQPAPPENPGPPVITPPEPSPPSAVVLALTRLADMKAELEFAYAKHMLLKAKHRNLRAQFNVLEKLPIGIEAIQDDLDALQDGQMASDSQT